ncbi:MAG: translation elongation factor Ts [Actinobacteria bacterium]|nr:MAG: translation elongation factor Ts [Actinomycetota bacterium]
MAEIKAADVKALREATGAGMMDVKKALQDADGDAEKAKDLLRERGLASAKKYGQRAAEEGVVEAYLHKPDPHMPAKLGVMIELNCATDFVAKTERFRDLAKQICMHISHARPVYLTRDEVPDAEVDREREIYVKQAQAEGKPEKIIPKIVEGKLEAFYADVCLLDQKWIRDDSKTIGHMLDEASSELKEPVKVRRFAYFKVGA